MVGACFEFGVEGALGVQTLYCVAIRPLVPILVLYVSHLLIVELRVAAYEGVLTVGWVAEALAVLDRLKFL